MKYLKAFENKNRRKFEIGDIVKYKYSNSQPFKILDWDIALGSYRVKDLSDYNYITFLRSNLIEIYPPDKLEKWYINQKALRYNL